MNPHLLHRTRRRVRVAVCAAEPGNCCLDFKKTGGPLGFSFFVEKTIVLTDKLKRCILYIVRRTQLYLEDDLWAALHSKALLEGATISELVRVAVRERYMANHEQRRQAMLDVVGLWKDRADVEDAESFIRSLRDDDRQQRLKRPRAK